MGICLGKHRKKRNTVSPSNAEEDLRKGSTRRKAPEDMIKDLEDANAEDSRVANAGVSFSVDFQDGDPTRMPSRLADKLDGAITPEDDNEVTYTAEERQMLAELMIFCVRRKRRPQNALEPKMFNQGLKGSHKSILDAEILHWIFMAIG